MKFIKRLLIIKRLLRNQYSEKEICLKIITDKKLLTMASGCRIYCKKEKYIGWGKNAF